MAEEQISEEIIRKNRQGRHAFLWLRKILLIVLIEYKRKRARGPFMKSTVERRSH